MTISQESSDSEHGLPDSIRSALQSRYGPVPGVSPEIDTAILADARQQLSTRIQPVRRSRRWSAWRWTVLASTLAAAAVLVLALRPQQPQGIDHDFDQSGQVDILDAFAMARHIRDGGTGARDLNGDGLLDQVDIDLVAREAVRL